MGECNYHKDVRVNGLGAGSNQCEHALLLALLLDRIGCCIAAVASNCNTSTSFFFRLYGAPNRRLQLAWLQGP